MKLRAFIAALMIATTACSMLSRPATSTPAAAAAPTFFIVLPTATGIPPTQVLPTFPVKVQGPTPTRFIPVPTPTSTLTPTPNVPWPVSTLTIVSSLPMIGPTRSTAKAFVNAETLRLRQANFRACGGKYGLDYQAMDASSKYAGGWDASVETENATSAVEASSVIAYLGAFNSDAAKLVIPMLDQAGPLLVMSASNTYPGFTKTVFGIPDEPGKYYPSGVHNFARVVTTDDVQATVSAAFMSRELGVKSIFILDDGQLYGQSIADVFESSVKLLGIQVTGRETIDPKARSYDLLMWRIAASNNGKAPDAIFAGMLAEDHAGQVLKDKVAVLGDNTKVKFMGPGGLNTPALIEAAGPPATEGIYAAAPGLPFPDGLTDAGKKFVKDYEDMYGGVLTEPSAIYAYESMNVLLKAINDVCASGGDPTDRRQVRDAVFAINGFTGALGTWTFDQNGDTSLTNITIYTVKNGAWQVVETIK